MDIGEGSEPSRLPGDGVFIEEVVVVGPVSARALVEIGIDGKFQIEVIGKCPTQGTVGVHHLEVIGGYSSGRESINGGGSLGVGEELVTEACFGEKLGELLVLNLGGKAGFWGGNDLPGTEGVGFGRGVKDIAIVERLAVDGGEKPWLRLFLGGELNVSHIGRQGLSRDRFLGEIRAISAHRICAVHLLPQLHVLTSL